MQGFSVFPTDLETIIKAGNLFPHVRRMLMEEKKSTPLGGRVWFSAVFFGLIGQIAWIVENM